MVFIIFVFGLIVGSFLNAVIYRLFVARSIFETHSICPHCQHQLSALDLVPVLSFAVLGGRCRYCRKKISIQYPAVEMATALSFVLVYITSVIPAQAGIQTGSPIDSGMTMSLIFQLLFTSLLIVIFVYDLKHYLILDKVVFPAAVLALVYQYWQGDLQNAFYGALFLAGFFAFLYVVSRGRYIGAGDIKLGIFLGLLVPFPQTLALFLIAYISGALVSAPLLFLKKKSMGDKLPFGTFLTGAAFVCMLWGESIINWYFNLIGIR